MQRRVVPLWRHRHWQSCLPFRCLRLKVLRRKPSLSCRRRTTFNWNASVYCKISRFLFQIPAYRRADSAYALPIQVVIIFAALMSLLVIGMILHHIHQGSKARSKAHQSFFSGDASKQPPPPTKATSKLENLKRFRKSKIFSPAEAGAAAESSPTEMQRPSSSDDLLEWNRPPPPRLRPRDVADDSASFESGRRGNQMTLAEALMREGKGTKAHGTGVPGARDMS